MSDQGSGTSLVEWLSATGALLPVLVGLVALAVTFWRRPNLTLQAMPEHSRVERDPSNTALPFLRLVARNGRWHRASQGTRVLVEHVQPVGEEKVYLGSPPLGWASAADQVDVSVVIFPDGARTVDLGRFDSYIAPDQTDEWCLKLVPYLEIFESRNRLLAQDDGYIIRVVIGSDDGRARRYDVRVNWDPLKRLVEKDSYGQPIREWNADELLGSVEYEVKRVRR